MNESHTYSIGPNAADLMIITRHDLEANYVSRQAYDDLRAEVDALKEDIKSYVVTAHFDAIMQDELRAELATGNHLYALATDKINDLEAEIVSWQNREAACCPEDRGFEEVIATLRQEISVKDDLLRRSRESEAK